MVWDILNVFSLILIGSILDSIDYDYIKSFKVVPTLIFLSTIFLSLPIILNEISLKLSWECQLEQVIRSNLILIILEFVLEFCLLTAFIIRSILLIIKYYTRNYLFYLFLITPTVNLVMNSFNILKYNTKTSNVCFQNHTSTFGILSSSLTFFILNIFSWIKVRYLNDTMNLNWIIIPFVISTLHVSFGIYSMMIYNTSTIAPRYFLFCLEIISFQLTSRKIVVAINGIPMKKKDGIDFDAISKLSTIEERKLHASNKITTKAEFMNSVTTVQTKREDSDLDVKPKQSVNDLNVNKDLPQYSLTNNISSGRRKSFLQSGLLETLPLEAKKIESIQLGSNREMDTFNSSNNNPIANRPIRRNSSIQFEMKSRDSTRTMQRVHRRMSSVNHDIIMKENQT